MTSFGRKWPENKKFPPSQHKERLPRRWTDSKSVKEPKGKSRLSGRTGPRGKLPQGCASNRPLPIIDSCPARGRLAQLVRAPRSHRGGRRFKSSIAHHVAGTREPGRCPDSSSRGGGTADALRSGRSILSDVWVQIPPSAPNSNRLHGTHRALVAQRIERCPAEAEVVSSNLAKRTISLPF